MKKAMILVAVIVAFCSTATTAQTVKQYTVKAGENVLKIIPLSDRCQFPEYQNGGVFYKDGHHSPRMKMNYNILAGALTFLTPKGDTLAYKKDPEILFAEIGNEVFYYDKKVGFVNIVVQDDKVQLALQKQWDIVRKESAVGDGYGYVSQTTGLSASLNQRGTNNSYIVNENTVFATEYHYFLVDQKHAVFFANKAGFFSAFPFLKDEIKSYLLDNGGFHLNKDCIEKLYSFCIKLEKQRT